MKQFICSWVIISDSLRLGDSEIIELGIWKRKNAGESEFMPVIDMKNRHNSPFWLAEITFRGDIETIRRFWTFLEPKMWNRLNFYESFFPFCNKKIRLKNSRSIIQITQNVTREKTKIFIFLGFLEFLKSTVRAIAQTTWCHRSYQRLMRILKQ